MKKPNNKTTSSISAERVVQQILARFNPIRGLDPARLAAILDDYQRGYIAQAAQLWATIERRDPQCQSVIPKRKRATSLLEYEVLVEDDSPEAARQREALEYFYANVSATDALQRNMRGGFSTLVMQMMDAVGKGYAVHEILWKPARNAEGRDVLTAECVFTPLWFFENRTGSLRFLPQDYAVDGLPLAEGGWMVTVPATGIPLMEATSVAYVYKNLSLKDWLIFSERYGMPLPVGKTSASQGSPEWNAFADALRSVGQDWGLVIGNDGSVDFKDAGCSGERPQQPLVEYMDEAIAILWRGGDLSTRSDDATGASQQDEERENIEAADAQMVNETLWQYVDAQIIRALFGPEAPVLAYVALKPKLRVDSDREMKVWDFAVSHGVPLAKSDFRKRFGLPSPEVDANGTPTEELLVQPAAPALDALPMPAANEAGAEVPAALREASMRLLAKASDTDMAAVRDALDQWLKDVEDGKADPTEPPDLLTLASSEATAKALESILGAHVVEAVINRPQGDRHDESIFARSPDHR